MFSDDKGTAVVNAAADNLSGIFLDLIRFIQEVWAWIEKFLGTEGAGPAEKPFFDAD